MRVVSEAGPDETVRVIVHLGEQVDVSGISHGALDVAEARSRGYDVKVLRKLIALRKRDSSEVSEEEAILELYKQALGM